MKLHPALAGAARAASRWLRRCDRGAVGVELGVIAVPFFVVFLGVMEVAYDLYVQAQLDNAVDLTARGVQVGSSIGVAGLKENTFVQNDVCKYLAGSLSCNPNVLIVGVACIPTGKDYYSAPISTLMNVNDANGSKDLTTGGPGQMMALEAWYEGPTFVGLLIPSFTKYWGTQLVHETTSTAGFVNEYFPGGGESC